MPTARLVDVLHGDEELLGDGELAGTEPVEEVAAQLGGRLDQPVEPGGQFDAHLIARRQPIPADEHAGEDRLGVLLFGVVQKAGEGDHREGPTTALGLTQRLLSFGEQGWGLGWRRCTARWRCLTPGWCAGRRPGPPPALRGPHPRPVGAPQPTRSTRAARSPPASDAAQLPARR